MSGDYSWVPIWRIIGMPLGLALGFLGLHIIGIGMSGKGRFPELETITFGCVIVGIGGLIFVG